MTDKTPPDRKSSSSSTSGTWAVSRPLGLGVSLATGFVVFAVGASLFPVSRPLPPPPRPPILASAPAPAPTPSADAQGPVTRTDDAGAPADAVGATDASAKVAADASTEAEKRADAGAPTDAGEPTGPDGGNESDPDCALADKDMAREAWRRNWPTLCRLADTGKAFILIPIKGSIEKAIVDLKRKPVREARVTLPDAESQLTLKLYKIRRMGFKDLKIGPPDDGTGVRLRVRLQTGAGDPVFEIKDGYAKITVAMPEKE